MASMDGETTRLLISLGDFSPSNHLIYHYYYYYYYWLK